MAGYKANTRAPTTAEKPAPRLPPPPLSDAEKTKAAATARQAKELMPEIVPIVKELYELGMIDGWRDVTIREITD